MLPVNVALPPVAVTPSCPTLTLDPVMTPEPAVTNTAELVADSVAKLTAPPAKVPVIGPMLLIWLPWVYAPPLAGRSLEALSPVVSITKSGPFTVSDPDWLKSPVEARMMLPELAELNVTVPVTEIGPAEVTSVLPPLLAMLDAIVTPTPDVWRVTPVPAESPDCATTSPTAGTLPTVSRGPLTKLIEPAFILPAMTPTVLLDPKFADCAASTMRPAAVTVAPPVSLTLPAFDTSAALAPPPPALRLLATTRSPLLVRTLSSPTPSTRAVAAPMPRWYR